jgi:hypothetical protein
MKYRQHFESTIEGNVFVLPAFDAALVRRRALILERACAARLGQVNPHFLAIFMSGEVVL